MYGDLPYPPPLGEGSHYPPLEQARKVAVQRSLLQHARTKALYDRRYQQASFQPGDMVMLETFYHPNSGKLKEPMHGPFKILRKISPVSFEINRPNQPLHRKTDIVHAAKLRAYHSPADFQLARTMSAIPILDRTHTNTL